MIRMRLGSQSETHSLFTPCSLSGSCTFEKSRLGTAAIHQIIISANSQLTSIHRRIDCSSSQKVLEH